MKRDPSTLLPSVRTYQKMLKDAGERWDREQGDEDIVIMAVALRALLVPDRPNGSPLLERVRALKRMLFVDSVPRVEGERLPDSAMGGGLTMFALGTERNRFVQPICWLPDNGPPRVFAPFPRWWEKDLAVKHGTRGYTRSFLVYEMANTDAVHIDDLLDADYHALSGAIENMTYNVGTGELPAEGVAQAALRQIAWEVVQTLDADASLSAIETLIRQSGNEAR